MKQFIQALLCIAFVSCQKPPPQASLHEPDYIPIRVAITTDAKNVSYWIADQPMSRDAIRTYLAECLSRFGNVPVWIIPDPTTTFESVAQLLADLKTIGYTSSAVIANQGRVVDDVSANRIEIDTAHIQTMEWSEPPRLPK